MEKCPITLMRNFIKEQFFVDQMAKACKSPKEAYHRTRDSRKSKCKKVETFFKGGGSLIIQISWLVSNTLFIRKRSKEWRTRLHFFASKCFMIISSPRLTRADSSTFSRWGPRDAFLKVCMQSFSAGREERCWRNYIFPDSIILGIMSTKRWSIDVAWVLWVLQYKRRGLVYLLIRHDS